MTMIDQKGKDDGDGASTTRASIRLTAREKWRNWRKPICLSVGLLLFFLLYFCLPFPAAEVGQNALVGSEATVQWARTAEEGLRPEVMWKIRV